MSPRRLAALALLATALVGVAHASELVLAPPTTASTAVVHRCAHADVQVTATAGRTELTVTGLPAACGGLPLRLWLHEAGTTHRTDAVVPEGGGPVTVTAPVPAGPGTAPLVTVDTWPLPTTAHVADAGTS